MDVHKVMDDIRDKIHNAVEYMYCQNGCLIIEGSFPTKQMEMNQQSPTWIKLCDYTRSIIYMLMVSYAIALELAIIS